MTHHPSVSVAVVGLGYGRNHAREAVRLGRTSLVGVVDPVPPATDPRLRDDPDRELIVNAAYAATLTDLLDRQQPDIVAIATPIHTHAELARTALAAGAHVLLEKPPTATLNEHDDLVRLARATGRAVQVGFQARASAALPAIRDLIGAGEIGRVMSIGVVGLWVRDTAYYQRAAWAGRRTLDGVTVMDGALTNPFAHAVDIALAIDGSLQSADIVDVEIDSWRAHDIESDDTTAALITTRVGTRIGIGVTLCAEVPESSPAVTVYGTAGTIRFTYEDDVVRVTNRHGIRVHTYSRVSLLENLTDHVIDGTPLVAPLDTTGSFMAVLEAMRSSPPPTPVDQRWLTWHGTGDQSYPSIAGVDAVCKRVASQGRSFRQLRAPWTTAVARVGHVKQVANS